MIPSNVAEQHHHLDCGDRAHFQNMIIVTHHQLRPRQVTIVNIVVNIIANLDDFLAVGSYNPSNVKAELYDYGTGDWTSVQDYPFGSGPSVYAFDMLFIGELSAYFVIGGYDTNFSVATIAKFKNGAWSHAGRLNSARQVLYFSLLFFFYYQIIRVTVPNGWTEP